MENLEKFGKTAVSVYPLTRPFLCNFVLFFLKLCGFYKEQGENVRKSSFSALKWTEGL